VTSCTSWTESSYWSFKEVMFYEKYRFHWICTHQIWVFRLMRLDSQQYALTPYGSHSWWVTYSQVVRKLLVFCSAQRFITVLTTAPLTCPRLCESSAPVFPSYFFNILSSVTVPYSLRTPWRLFCSGFPTKPLYELYLLSHAFNVACPSHSTTDNNCSFPSAGGQTFAVKAWR
jgi:hypothetical protein